MLRHVEPLGRLGVEVSVAELGRRSIPTLSGYDAVWWHRGLLGPAMLRRLDRARPRGAAMVLDYDDPLPHSARGGGRSSLSRRWKFAALLKRMDAAMAASGSLAALARGRVGRVTVVPMAVDLPRDLPAERAASAGEAAGGRDGDGVELIWAGSPATQPYLDAIAPALAEVSRRRPGVVLRLVSHAPPSMGGVPVRHEPWSPAAEEAALRTGAVGLCPMPDTAWTRGKCPYKVLRYMAYALPWVGSDVGENRVAAGPASSPRGLLAADAAQWVEALVGLIDDAGRRGAMGRAGRAYVEAHHQRDAVARRIAAVLRGEA